MKKLIGMVAFTALGGVVTLAGCGGGSGSSTALGSSSRAAVILTDSPREDYAHVWATIYHVELVPQTGGTAVVLFDDPTGRLIDLKTLRDSTGQRFSYLASATVAAGTYTGITVSVGTKMQLYRNGVAVGSPLTVDSSLPKDSSGHPMITDTFTTAKTLTAGTNNLVVDFDLASFTVTGTTILPVIKDGDAHGAGLGDPNRHNSDAYHGTVSNLTGTSPTLSFTLTRGSGSTVTVTTTAATTLYGVTTTNALANGSIVEVTGTLDTTTQNLVATAIEVRPTTDSTVEHDGTCPPHLSGAASALDATAGTFTVTVSMAHGFTPTGTTVNVVTNSTTVYRADAGTTETEAAFFTALAATPTADVEGTYDATTNTLTATSLRVVDATQNGGWENDQHNFRRGSDSGHWGNGAFGGH